MFLRFLLVVIFIIINFLMVSFDMNIMSYRYCSLASSIITYIRFAALTLTEYNYLYQVRSIDFDGVTLSKFEFI